MSITYCHNCNRNIDEDFDVEHFDVCGKEEAMTNNNTQTKIKDLPVKYKAIQEVIDDFMSDWSSEHVLYEVLEYDRVDVYLWSDYEGHETFVSFRFNSKGELEMLDGNHDYGSWIKVTSYNAEVKFWRNAYFNK